MKSKLLSSAAVAAFMLSATLAMAQSRDSGGGGAGASGSGATNPSGSAAGEQRGQREETGQKAQRQSEEKAPGANEKAQRQSEEKAPSTNQKAQRQTEEKAPTANQKAQEKSGQAPGGSQQKQSGEAAPSGSNQKSQSQTGQTGESRQGQSGQAAPGATQPKQGQQGSSQQTTGAVDSSTSITTEQRTQLRQKISSVSSLHRVDNVNFTISVGTTVPETVTYYDLPPEIIEVVPAYRRYKYILVGHRMIIIDPGRRVIIDVIEV